MYQALYRKWRPRTFDDVVGQEQVTETLKNQVINDRLSHAYLFVGTRGTGKTTCAKILARAVNCENPQNGSPCNQCKSCRGIEDGSIMDVLEIDAASNNGVDNVRALRDEAIYSPAVVKKRVYIIDEVHMLSGSAFNALLKILEEPPAHLMFILATTELNKVPATILSRCQRHSFKRADQNSLAKRISYVAGQENLSLDAPAAALLARLADGSFRDGLSLLDQCSGNSEITAEMVLSAMGLAGNLRIAELLTFINQNRTAEALDLFGKLWNDGKAPGALLTEMGALLRDVLMTKVAKKGGTNLLSGAFDENTLNTFVAEMTAEELISNIDTIQTAVGTLRDGRDPKVSAELCIIGLCEPDLGEALGYLRTRVAKLEKLFSEAPRTSTPAPVTSPPAFAVPELVASPPEPVTSAPVGPPREEVHQEEYVDERPPFDDEDEPIISQEDIIGEKVSVQDSGVEVGILSELEKNMPTPLWMSMKGARLEVIQGKLEISVDSGFKKTMLEGLQIQEMIRAAIQVVTGHSLPFKIVAARLETAGDSGKLEGLSKFGNVRFE